MLTIAHLSDIHYAPAEVSEISTMLKDKGVLVEGNTVGISFASFKNLQPSFTLINCRIIPLPPYLYTCIHDKSFYTTFQL